MGEKKQHEISIMAPLVQAVSTQAHSNLVVDIGCGLGYLGQTLGRLYNSEVLGFESKDSNCQGVRKRNLSLDTGNIVTQQLNVNMSKECTEAINSAVVKHCNNSSIEEALTLHRDAESNSNNHKYCSNHSDPCVEVTEDTSFKCHRIPPRVCLVGLHCCGDLTPSTLQQFCDIDSCKSLVCMSCCYHRLTYDQNSGTFNNFPMSKKLQEVYLRLTTQHGRKLNSLALRLACQETQSRWVCTYTPHYNVITVSSVGS